MTNITLGVFTYGNTDSEKEGQTLTTRHALPPRVKIPKLVWDCASTAHIVVRAEMLDDYVPSVPPTTVRWGTEGNIMLSHGVGTLRTRNHLPFYSFLSSASTFYQSNMWLLRNRGVLSCSWQAHSSMIEKGTSLVGVLNQSFTLTCTR